jgi:hypothetical protein
MASCAAIWSSLHSNHQITYMSKYTDPTTFSKTSVVNLGLISSLGLRMRVCSLFSSSGAADLQRVGILKTLLGFQPYPVRGRR